MRLKQLIRAVLLLGIAAAAISGFADDASQEYAQKSLNRALVTYAAARTLNGVVSVAQGTEVALEPGGVGVILTPGQVLDPINDLIEQFSGVMLVAASSLGLQMILLKITSTWAITALLVAALAAWLVLAWRPAPEKSNYRAFIINASLLLVFVRFVVPVVIICTNFLFDSFLLGEHDEAAASLEKVSMTIEETTASLEASKSTPQESSASAAESQSSGNYLLELYESAVGSTREAAAQVADWFDKLSVGESMAKLKVTASEATGHIIDLIVIFVLQTILFPLGFLWLFFEALKITASRTIASIGS